MAAYILETSTISLGGVDYSDQAMKIELTVQVAEKDVTTFVGDGAKAVIGGQESGNLKVEFLSDLGAAALDSAMWAAMKGRQPIAFVTKITDAAVSTTNPSFSGNCLVNKWTPISGSPGDEAKLSCDFPTSGATTRNVA